MNPVYSGRGGYRHGFYALGVILALSLTTGCDDPFSPLASDHHTLSVFGSLDAAADTQWVRVMPVRPSVLTSPGSFDAHVTLERIGTSQTVTLRDSVFRFTHHENPELGSEGAFVHNFWTTERLDPGANYRFMAVVNGAEPAESVVQVPRDYPVEVWLGQKYGVSDYLRLYGVDHVPFLTVRAHFYDNCGESVDTVRVGDREQTDDGYAVFIRREPVTPREGCGRPGIEKRTLWMVVSREEWPSAYEYAARNLGVMEGPSNVTNAIGFLGAVLTKTIPYERCDFQDAGNAIPDHCRLRYDDRSALVRGRVMETRCGDGPLELTTIELRELDGDPATRKIRTTLTDRRGEFQIGALEEGRRYFLKARAQPEPDPFWGEVDIHNIHTDTVQFSVGQAMTYDVELRRFTACGGMP